MIFKTKKQTNRFNRLMIDGGPKYVRCYDNVNKSLDHYTVVFTGNYTRKTNGEQWYLGMSSNPFHPQGIGQHGSSKTQIDKPRYSHLGKKVKFNDLSQDAQDCVMQTYLYLWDLTDENNIPIG